MTRHEKFWVSIAFFTLTIATFLGFTATLRNFDDHKRIDKTTCDRDLADREIMARTITILAANPGELTPEAKEELRVLNQELHALIEEAKNNHCSKE